MKWVNIIAGVVLFLAPFVFGFSGTPSALWTCLILGVAIAILGYMSSYKWLALAGLVTILVPFIFGFNAIGAALWISLIVGVVVLIMDGYRAFFSGEAKSGGMQQHHA